MPKEACAGGGQAECAEGYTGVPCALCAEGYHRLEQQCVPCPSNAPIMLGLYVTVLVAAVATFMYLQSKKINLAALSMAIDFLQVLAMFGSFQLEWPPQLQTLFVVSSSSNYNVELVAPECSLSFSFLQKWVVMQTLPVAYLCIIMLIAGAAILHARWRAIGCSATSPQYQRFRKAVDSWRTQMVGFAVTGMYTLYFVTVRLSLSVFDCSLGTDGVAILDADPSVKCWTREGDHAILVPAGIVTLVVYGLGIPAVILGVFVSHRTAIRADQDLFAVGAGGSRATNPFFEVRKRYRKLYKDFRPQFYYWRLVLLTRKFVLALTMILFNELPLFQATLSVTVLFLSYVLHSHFHPFLTAKPFDKQFVRQADGTLAFRAAGSASGANKPTTVTALSMLAAKTNTNTITGRRRGNSGGGEVWNPAASSGARTKPKASLIIRSAQVARNSISFVRAMCD